MYFPTIVLFLLLTLCHGQQENAKVYYYYKWAPYNDAVLPDKAFVTGLEHRKNMYVGISSDSSSEIAGKVIQGRAFLEIVEKNAAVTYTENIRLLTVRNPSAFHWIPANIDKIELPENLRPVILGSKGNSYIARGIKNGQQTVGSFVCDNFPVGCVGIVFLGVDYYGDREYYPKYEILAHET